jgi:hypothetical protein
MFGGTEETHRNLRQDSHFLTDIHARCLSNTGHTATELNFLDLILYI